MQGVEELQGVEEVRTSIFSLLPRKRRKDKLMKDMTENGIGEEDTRADRDGNRY